MAAAVASALGILVGCGLALGLILDGWSSLFGMLRSVARSL